MKGEQEYFRHIAEMRSMMERSTKFLSLSGWAGIMAGIYALSGAYIAYAFLGFRPDSMEYSAGDGFASGLGDVIVLAAIVLVLAIGTAIFLSSKKAHKAGEKIWNATAQRLLINMAVPLVVGGVLMLILLSKGFAGLMAPFTLIFYGLALYNASKFTYEEVRSLGLMEIGLGLISAYYVGYGLLFWALGFGVLHIVYGVYMHYRYEK